MALGIGNQMADNPLPQSTIEYLNNGAPAGQRNEALFAAAAQYRDAGYSEHIALEDLGERGEADGLTMREAHATIRSAYRAPSREPIGHGRALPPRAERFQARGKEKPPQPKGRTAKSVMRGRKVDSSLPQPLEDPVRSLLRIAFKPGEFINITLGKHIDGEIKPGDAGRTRLFEEWMEIIEKAGGDWAAVPGANDLGTYICLNPLKGRDGGRKNSEVAAYRHVLVEFDEIPQAEQWALLQSSRLPLTAVIDSGGKSVHGWVRIDAANKEAYDQAVAEIYTYFDDYKVDGQNKNPSRLSRLAGAPRGDRQQSLLAMNLGMGSFAAWLRWQSKEPEIMSWEDVEAASIPQPEILIEGILHKGSKMTIGGGSKSFKSWSLLDLGVAVSTGQDWWGHRTRQCKTLIVDFELDRYHWRERVRSIITGKGGTIPHDLDVLPMRGRMATFEMIRKYVMEACERKEYGLIILDPIYKCLGGRDENAAGDVAELMNEVEALTLETGAAVVIAAHYSKGNQAAKDSLDRISGSGVFARDPDTILAMTKHEDEGSFTVDVTVRNFEPIQPFVVSWRWPLMVRNRELSPDDIKLPPNERARQPKITVAAFLRELKGVKPMTKDELKDKTMAAFGIGKSKFYEVFKEAEASGKLVCVCGLYRVKEDDE